MAVRSFVRFGDEAPGETRPRQAFPPHKDTIDRRGLSISSAQHIEAGGIIPAASLLYARGERPSTEAVAELAQGGSGFSVSFDPVAEGAAASELEEPARDGSGRWLELLSSGLTFDLVGLAPLAPAPDPPRGYSFGLPEWLESTRLEAITLKPGPHLAGGATMQPVVRALAGLTARLTGLSKTAAVVWHPARCWSLPHQFRDSVDRWLSGGVFPAFSLAALGPMPDGGMQSEGLALFTGQELRLEPELLEDRAAGGRIGLRLLHWLAERGAIDGPEDFEIPDIAALRIEPSANGRFVRAWKAAE